MKPPKTGADDFVASGLSEADLLALPREALALTIERHGDEFKVSWAEHQVECLLTVLHENGDGVTAELSVRHGGTDIHWGRLGLASTSSREGLVRKLRDVVPEAPRRAILERTCRDVAQATRQTAPALLLEPRRAIGPRYLINPLAPAGETTVIFGDGGVGKSLLALALERAANTGTPLPGGIFASRRVKTMFLDYETCAEGVGDWLYPLSRGFGCSGEGLHYRRMVRPLAEEATALRGEISRLDIGLVIVDSFGPASGPEPEGADAAIRTLNALRTFGSVTRLVLAHVRRADADHRGAARPFGSVFIWNLARSAWELRRSDEESEDLRICLYHRKANLGRLHPPIPLRFTFEPDAVTLRQAELGESPDLLARTSLAFQIRQALSLGGRTVPELVEDTGARKDTVARILRRLRKADRAVDLGEGRWGLKA